jgi:magnesium transporter
MKVLTIFSAVFIPLSFLAGVFGMNFQNMPILQNENGILLFIGLCVGVILLMLGFFKLKKWF